jgi:Acetylornithine deacetylase/Succinyl-diaminopimelate desuccinylase and related deacylases
VTVRGQQGHAAYPHRALNPMPAMARLMDRLSSHALDTGTAHFDPSTLAVVTIDTGNPATNVIPAETRATLNIRFNDLHTGEKLAAWLRDEAAAVDAAFGTRTAVAVKISGEAFLTPPGPLSDLVAAAVRAETGRVPVLSTSGGTSDARFMRAHCPVVEFGLVGKGMHAVDEAVPVDDIRALSAIYHRILTDYFA